MSPRLSIVGFRRTRLVAAVLACALAGTAGAVITGHEPAANASEQKNGGKRHRVVTSPDAPAAIGPYSQAIAVGDALYLSGQLPIDPVTNKLLAGASIEDQTRQVLRNLDAVLRAGGMTLDNVVSTTVYVADLNEFARFNTAYAEFFGSKPPARATVQVARVPQDAKVEISAIAVR
ncbi:RidA family protein [Micromonospora halotolerans]|uniref:RidA family protein n=1 Tax=Micromonospora halotolerans TaxID=709879 RepID=A0ABY9ZTP2_9ACTN|nr:RidA family protein [Micromonospora halotolerans]WNM38598.1 RidA family protein [Micromonospora halotolerans]